MSMLDRRHDGARRPLRSRLSQKHIRRQHVFLGIGSLLFVALVVTLLSQFGVLSFLWNESTSTLQKVTVSGVVRDAQTGQPLANVPITARVVSFESQTTTNGQGYFFLRVPKASQIIISAPNYDAQAVSPGSDLAIKLVPDPVETARRFMSAFMQQRFDQLWSMLAPNEQAFWASETDFASFLTRKFGQLPRLSFSIGQAKTFPGWIDPDTTWSYQNVAVLPVSLTLGPTAGILTPPSEEAIANGLFRNLGFAEIKSGGLWRVLVSGPLDQEAPIIVPAKVPAVTARVPILMYHHVSSLPPKNILDYSLTVKTRDFAAQMSYLAAKGYHPITLTDVFDNLYYRMPLPPHPIVLSFDDGYEDNFVYAFPILQQHHFVAEINIITGMIGGWYLTWNQIRQMNADGIEIGSHTIHHLSLASVFPVTAEKELAGSKATLEQQLGHFIQFFCYPSGEPFHHGTQARRQFITSLLYQDGYVGALLDPGAESIVQNPQLPYQLPRVRVPGGTTLGGFIWLLKLVGA
jgi:peptidoglycan/xylan/chitin deacetylase (PgdA/CDA1 family)